MALDHSRGYSTHKNVTGPWSMVVRALPSYISRISEQVGFGKGEALVGLELSYKPPSENRLT